MLSLHLVLPASRQKRTCADLRDPLNNKVPRAKMSIMSELLISRIITAQGVSAERERQKKILKQEIELFTPGRAETRPAPRPDMSHLGHFK